jgi:hypothetical protein
LLFLALNNIELGDLFFLYILIVSRSIKCEFIPNEQAVHREEDIWVLYDDLKLFDSVNNDICFSINELSFLL